MFSRHIVILAAGIALALASSASAGIIRAAGKASTSSKSTSTTTSGQTQITNTIDPIGITEFQLDVSFEADKVSFDSITGLNGYIVTSFNLITRGAFGEVDDIHGYYQGPLLLSSPDVSPGSPLPPPGEVDIFQIIFNDNAPQLPKTFTTFADDPQDFLRGVDEGGGLVEAFGPFNPDTGLGIEPSSSTVNGIGIPLPPAVWMGLLSAALALHARRKS